MWEKRDLAMCTETLLAQTKREEAGRTRIFATRIGVPKLGCMGNYKINSNYAIIYGWNENCK
jgi:hypothetical protein